MDKKFKKEIKVKVSNIKWEGVEGVDIPTELLIIFPTELLEDGTENDYEDIISEYISEEISNETGFCHTGFVTDIDGDINKIKDKKKKSSKK